MRDYNLTTVTLSEVIKRWRDGDKKILYWMAKDFPGLMVWLEKDPVGFIDQTFGHIHAGTVNRRVRDWSGVEPEKPRGKPRKDLHMPPPLQNVPVKDEVLPVDQTGQQEESRQQAADIPPVIPVVDGSPPAPQTVEEALREIEQEEGNEAQD